MALRDSSSDALPWHWILANGQLHFFSRLPSEKILPYPLNKLLFGSQSPAERSSEEIYLLPLLKVNQCEVYNTKHRPHCGATSLTAVCGSTLCSQQIVALYGGCRQFEIVFAREFSFTGFMDAN